MKHVSLPAASMLASALSIVSLGASAQIGAVGSGADDSGLGTDTSDTSLGLGSDTSLGLGSDTSMGLGSDTSLGLGSDTSLGLGSDTSLGLGSDTSLGFTIGTSIGSTTTSSLTGPSSLLGPLDLGTNPPFSTFGRFLPGVGPNASGTMPSPRLPASALGSTTSTLGAPSSLLGPLDLGTNPPFSSFGRFLPGVGPNASGSRPSPRLPTPGAAPSAASSAGGGVVWDSFCDPEDFTCDE